MLVDFAAGGTRQPRRGESSPECAAANRSSGPISDYWVYTS